MCHEGEGRCAIGRGEMCHEGEGRCAMRERGDVP